MSVINNSLNTAITPINLSQGGSNAVLTASDGGVVYSTASAMAILAGTSTPKQILLSGLSGAPSWSTATFASTYATSSLLYSDGVNNVVDLATVNSASLNTDINGVPTWVPLAAGEIIIGSNVGPPGASTLTAGNGISINNASNSITISANGSGIVWTEITLTTHLMAANNGYVANNAGLVTLTLPVAANFGTMINIIGKGAGGWLIAQNGGQNIQVGSLSSTVGGAGSVASTNRFDSITLVCTTQNTTWTVLGGPQSAGLTVV